MADAGPRPILPSMAANCIAWKGHEIVAFGVLKKNTLAYVNHRSIGVFRCLPVILFFVRVNQVLVRLWARAMEARLCLVFVPLLRLMSDRESASGVSRPRFGCRKIRRYAPRSDSEGSETLCVMIRMRSALLKERKQFGFCAKR